MAEREHRDPSQEALQKQKKKGRAIYPHIPLFSVQNTLFRTY